MRYDAIRCDTRDTNDTHATRAQFSKPGLVRITAKVGRIRVTLTVPISGYTLPRARLIKWTFINENNVETKCVFSKSRRIIESIECRMEFDRHSGRCSNYYSSYCICRHFSRHAPKKHVAWQAPKKKVKLWLDWWEFCFIAFSNLGTGKTDKWTPFTFIKYTELSLSSRVPFSLSIAFLYIHLVPFTNTCYSFSCLSTWRARARKRCRNTMLYLSLWIQILLWSFANSRALMRCVHSREKSLSSLANRLILSEQRGQTRVLPTPYMRMSDTFL